MDDEKFKELAELEDKYGAAVVSPQLQETMRGKSKQHFFYMVLQDTTGKIVDICHGSDYNEMWVKGTEKAKEAGLSWSIFSLSGKFVDGNFNGKK